MEEQEIENLIEANIDLLNQQYIIPLTLALGAITTVISRDPSQGSELAGLLRTHASNCPEEVAGRKLLEALAELADGRIQHEPGVPRSALQQLLWLPRKDARLSQGTGS